MDESKAAVTKVAQQGTSQADEVSDIKQLVGDTRHRLEQIALQAGDKQALQHDNRLVNTVIKNAC